MAAALMSASAHAPVAWNFLGRRDGMLVICRTCFVAGLAELEGRT